MCRLCGAVHRVVVQFGVVSLFVVVVVDVVEIEHWARSLVVEGLLVVLVGDGVEHWARTRVASVEVEHWARN